MLRGQRRTSSKRWCWVRRLACGTLLGTAAAARAVDFAVDANIDAVDAMPGDGVCATAAGACTLRAAVQEANALEGADTITLPAATYRLSLTGANEDGAATGDLDLRDTLTIVGPTSGTARIDANRTDRAFDVLSGANVVMTGITIENGSLLSDNGAGIRNAGTLRLDGVTVTRNVTANGDGGGIVNLPGATLHATGVTLSLNVAAASGGGLANLSGATAQLTNATFSANSSLDGGGVFNAAEPSMTTTLLELSSVTLNDNSAATGASIRNLGTARIGNSIIANVPAVATCSGKAVESLGYNILSDSLDPCGFDQPTDRGNTDPLLDSLRDNGGDTATHALRPGSPAIDSGDPVNCPPTDQRSATRPQDGNGDGMAICDVGAYEVAGPATPSPTPTGSETATPFPTPTPTEVTPTPTFPSLDVETVTGYPGQQTDFTVRLRTQGAIVVNAQAEIAFDALNTPILATSHLEPDCTVNPDIHKEPSLFTFVPFGCNGPACTAVRSFVFSGPSVPIPDGSALYTCRIGISPSAPLGEYPLTVSMVEMTDALGNIIPGTQGNNGKVLVIPAPTDTPTQTPTVTPTASVTPTPTRLPCTGDCGGDGTVTIDDIVLMVNIAAGDRLPSSCPGESGVVTVDTTLIAVRNTILGCP